MFIIDLMFKNDVLKLLITLILFLFIFYTFGKIIQNYFSLKENNNYLAIPMGWTTYMLLTFFVYLPMIFLEISINSLLFIEFIKNLIIIFIIIIYYKIWFPKFKFNFIKFSETTFLLLTIIL